MSVSRTQLGMSPTYIVLMPPPLSPVSVYKGWWAGFQLSVIAQAMLCAACLGARPLAAGHSDCSKDQSEYKGRRLRRLRSLHLLAESAPGANCSDRDVELHPISVGYPFLRLHPILNREHPPSELCREFHLAATGS